MTLALGNEVSPIIALFAIVLGAVVVSSLILLKFKQSLLVGYFICGVVLANTGLTSWLGEEHQQAVTTLSEIGIVLLMFTLGIEFSLRELIHLKRIVLGGGAAQITLTTLAGVLILTLMGLSGVTLLIVAFALAISSTAVSIKSFQDMNLPNTPGARMTLGIAIFQDLAVILFMVLLPTLLENKGPFPIIIALGKGVLFLAICWFLSRRVIPQLLHAVAITRSRELFTICVVALCAIIAWGASAFGLSLALGAFAAGLVVSESIYSHRVLSDILPFKDLFLTIFFVSVGLLIDLETIANNWIGIAIGVTIIILIKSTIVLTIARFFKLRLKQALLTAAALSSSGEFSLVLLNQTSSLGGLDPALEQTLLACTAITMGLVPTLMRLAIPLSEKMNAIPFFQQKSAAPASDLDSQTDGLSDHVIVCGFGPVGQALLESMDRASIPVLIIEMNAETVRDLHQRGVPAIYADATKLHTLALARADLARAVAFTFPEPKLAIQGINAARAHNQEIVTFARAKFLSGVEMLQQAGVNHILHDEATSGKAMVDAVMGCYVNEQN